MQSERCCMDRKPTFNGDRLFCFLGVGISIPKSYEMRVRRDKIKFKKGLLSKRRKVTGRIDLKLSKVTSKTFSSNLQYKLNDKIASIKFRKGLLYEAVTVHGNWQKKISLRLGEWFLNSMTKHNKCYMLDFKKSSNQNEQVFIRNYSAKGKIFLQFSSFFSKRKAKSIL